MVSTLITRTRILFRKPSLSRLFQFAINPPMNVFLWIFLLPTPLVADLECFGKTVRFDLVVKSSVDITKITLSLLFCKYLMGDQGVPWNVQLFPNQHCNDDKVTRFVSFVFISATMTQFLILFLPINNKNICTLWVIGNLTLFSFRSLNAFV